MSTPNAFKTLFQRWPSAIPKRGVIVNTLGEANPFKSFMLRDDVLLLERTNPDAQGARFVLMEFASIATIKLIDPLGVDAFTSFGFEGKLSQ